MERFLEDGDEFLDFQGYVIDWRFVVCSFRDVWEEEEFVFQMYIKDLGFLRLLIGVVQDEGLQDSFLFRKFQLFLVVDELGDFQRGKVESFLVLLEGLGFFGVESFLCFMFFYFNLVQGEGDILGVGLVVDLGLSRVMLFGLSFGGLDSNFVGFGDFLLEKLLKLLEVGKEGWVREVWEGNRDVWRNEC